jgi:hypothetical protein
LFPTVIIRSDFTETNAEELLGYISADVVQGDDSLAATSRALLCDRLEQGETFRVSFIKNATASAEVLKHYYRRYSAWHTYAVFIFHLNNLDQDLSTAVDKALSENFKRAKDLAVFYKKMNADFFIGDNLSFIFLKGEIGLQEIHAVQAMLPRYVPKLFKIKKPTALEKELLESLLDIDNVRYESILQKLADVKNIREKSLSSKLKGIERIHLELELEDAKTTKSLRDRDYSSYMDMARNMLVKIQESNYTISGLKQSILEAESKGTSPLLDYFVCHRNVRLDTVVRSSLVVIVEGYADVFDSDAFESYVSNPNSSFYVLTKGLIIQSKLEKLYRALFETETLKLRVWAAYTVGLVGSVVPYSGYAYTDATRIPNPHIQKYGCIGGYETLITECLRRRDYVGALEQTSVSARNINFHDSTVMEDFSRQLISTTITCIEFRDGSLLTPIEAIKRLETE